MSFDVDDDLDEEERGFPKNATTELTSEEADDEDEKELTRSGDKGGGKNDDGDGFS